jgi:hypothetical protein
MTVLVDEAIALYLSSIIALPIFKEYLPISKTEQTIENRQTKPGKNSPFRST